MPGAILNPEAEMPGSQHLKMLVETNLTLNRNKGQTTNSTTVSYLNN